MHDSANGAAEPTQTQAGIAAAFKQALRGFASTVTVVTAREGDRSHGMTATAVTSLSMDPPALLVCVNRAALLHDVMTIGRAFCVNVLSDAHQAVSRAFSGASPPGVRFAHGHWAYRDDGLPYLADAQASIFCTKQAAFPYGTHMIFIGEVESVRLGDHQSPLIYQNADYLPPPRAVAAS